MDIDVLNNRVEYIEKRLGVEFKRATVVEKQQF